MLAARAVVTLLVVATHALAQQPALPAEFMKGLPAAQHREALEGLGKALPPACENALDCLAAATRDARLAFLLASQGRASDQIAGTINEAGRATAEPDEALPVRVEVTVPAYAPTRGPVKAPITITSWMDFDCPFSERQAGTFRQLERAYPGKLRFVFRQLPLPYHPNARQLALRSMAAHEKGRFWAFYDQAFDPAAKSKLELTTPGNQTAIARYGEQLAADEAELKRLAGASGTPTSFVNGVLVTGAQSLEFWRERVDAELAALGPARLGK